MGAASHLGIDLREYDARIRTFIPGYEEMLDHAAATVAATVVRRNPVIVDLGIGTGALASRCLAATPAARIVGVDEDEWMLAAARRRLGGSFTPRHGSFEKVELPPCDGVTASLALHHIPTRQRRLSLLRRINRVLRPRGVLIIADCYPATDPRIRAADRARWLAHLHEIYTARRSTAYLRAWAKEDFYVPLSDEIHLLQRAAFTVDVVWRRHAFAVVLGTRRR